MPNSLSENAWKRGWRDTKKGLGNWLFWILEAIVSPSVALYFNNGWIAIVVAIFGFVCLYLGATASAPIKQRNEARKYAVELENSIESIQDIETIVADLSLSIWMGKNLLRICQSNNTSSLTQEFGQWTSRTVGILRKTNSAEDAILFASDIDILSPLEATTKDYITALTNGINCTEKVVDRLKNSIQKERT